MSAKAEEQKIQLVERVLARVRERVAGDRGELATRFVSQLYRHVAPQDLLRAGEENLFGAALSLLGFAQRRAELGARVRLLNPSIEENGWRSPHSVIEIVNDDMPFLVDSMIAELNRLDVTVHLVIHPIVRVDRDGDGQLIGIGAEGAADPELHSESWMHVEIAEQAEVRHAEIVASLTGVLADVRAAYEDWQPMRTRCLDLIAELETNPPPLAPAEIAEGAELLRWIEDDHFTFLGYREYRFEGEGDEAVARVVEEAGLGVLRDTVARVFDGIRDFGRLPPDVRHFLREPRLLIITKSNQLSRVHRAVVYDAIAVKAFDAEGRVVGERVFVGLFTSVAYSRSPLRIPTLREKVQRTIERAGFAPRSHDAKTLQHILETYPRDELFQIGEDELFETSMGILHLQERQRVALFARRDPFERFVSCLVYVPRDRYETRLRLRFQAILAEAWNGKVTAFYTHVTDSSLARLQFIVKTVPGRVPKVDVTELEAALVQSARSWADCLQQVLIEERGEEKGLVALRRFGSLFPSSYQEQFSEQEALVDIARLEEVSAGEALAMNLFRPVEAPEHEARFKVYGRGATVPLSDILPMLENLGFKVIDEVPYVLSVPAGSERIWIRDFAMLRIDGAAVDIAEVRDHFHEVFAAVWRGAMENDGFNRLVLAGLDVRGVTAVRAWAKYLRQAQIPFSQTYMEQTLAGHPQIARLLVELFRTRFDPDVVEREHREAAIRAELHRELDGVSNLDEDRILRRFLNLVDSTLRTNFFQSGADGRPKAYVSFKLDSQAIDELPLPRPFREIWVYSPRVEAIHLRGGKVARGGIRWSDRREDFRTEVLGLMKAQMVKNAVIVPVGSKGGFVCKQLPVGGTREATAAEVEECYRTMMRGLLDLTDNRVGEEIVVPPRVIRLDDDDPYLVVAADKGTASFSDLANSVAAEYRFWLGDAFASGGSAGYDHKKMGITARGAWEGVKRHFRELGKDIQHQAFTVVGVGDMSGDVFGNGMLLSRQIRLVGAFDHRHVFLDPTPDPDAGWKERRRLFEVPRSSWADYDPTLISEGGGVWDRRAKTIPLSPQVQKLLGLKGASAPPHEVMQALLRLEVELLWFGGIGTYVKSGDESHADVGDRANDALRIDADELHCRVVGEGANLGMTQRARIEAGLRGVRLNTDFIDNSAGVDTSDHEVNIKILFGEVESAGEITRKQRDRLLAEMTDEVAELVLRDNYLQTQSLTVTQQLGPRLVDRLARWIRVLEKSGRLDRGIEFLPDDEELADRIASGRGLSRPELAIVLAYSKIALYSELVESDLPDDPALFGDLRRYFPTPLRDRFADAIGRHRLRREIVATVVTNEIVNRVGPSFAHEVREKTGMPGADVARAYLVSREVFRVRGLWAGIESLDTLVPASVQAAMLADCGRLVERATVWFLRSCDHPIDLGRTISTYAAGVAEIQDNLDDWLSRQGRKWLKDETKRLVQERVPEDLARRIAALGMLAPACDLVGIALDAAVPIATSAKTYFALGDRFGFDWLRRAALRLPTETMWDKLAATAIVDDLAAHQAELTRKVLLHAEGGEVDINRWARSRRLEVGRADQLVGELQATGVPSFAMLAVANRQLKSLSG